MKEAEIRKLVKIVEESNIAELEITKWGRTIKISKTGGGFSGNHIQIPQPAPPTAPPPAPAKTEETPQPKAEAPKSKSGNEMKSPMVGTFYRSPSPDANPYAEVGSTVKKGQVLCIIEAMKLMNEIESEMDGKIVDILVENGQPVEYNQPLFLIAPE